MARDLWRWGAAAAVALATLAVPACATTPPPPARDAGEALGVRVEAVRLSAAGYLLDLRYRVVDAERARALFERRARPLLVDGAGLQLGVPTAPKLGQLRSTGTHNAKQDRSFSMLFANPGRVVQRGARLDLVVGEARIPGLTVE